MRRLPKLLRHALRAWLGVEGEIAQLRADVDGHTEVAALLADQLNRTTLGAADLMRRLSFYEEHVDSVRYAHAKLKSAQNGQNGQNGKSTSRIIRLGGDA